MIGNKMFSTNTGWLWQCFNEIGAARIIYCKAVFLEDIQAKLIYEFVYSSLNPSQVSFLIYI